MSSLGRLGTADEVAAAAIWTAHWHDRLTRWVFCVPLTAVHVKVGQERPPVQTAPGQTQHKLRISHGSRLYLEIPRRTDRRGPPHRGKDRRYAKITRRSVLSLDACAGVGRACCPSGYVGTLGGYSGTTTSHARSTGRRPSLPGPICVGHPGCNRR